MLPDALPYEIVNLTNENSTLSLNLTNYTHVQGMVVNLVWLPPFSVEIPGLISCKFHPFEATTYAESRYKLECDYGTNVSMDLVYAPIPLNLLKEFEGMKTLEKDYYMQKGWLMFFELLSLAAITVLVSYIIYNEYWVYKT